MSPMHHEEPDITPELVVRGYCAGAFPMARHRHGPVEWFQPDPRALLPLDEDAFHVPASLRRRVRSGRFDVTFDRAFEQVIRACAEPRPYATETWINDAIIDAYTALHASGIAHSVEAWTAETPEDEPIGGLYGVALGGVFFGESMFSRRTDASKVCMVKLVEHLRVQGFVMLDVQFFNPHLAQFGLFELPHADYMQRLQKALMMDVSW